MKKMMGRTSVMACKNQAGILANGTVIPCCLDGEGVIHLPYEFPHILLERILACYPRKIAFLFPDNHLN